MSISEEIITRIQERFAKTMDNFKENISGISMKPNVNLFRAVRVDAYGGESPVTELAVVSISDAKTLMVRVHDSGIAGAVLKGIQAANLGVQAIMEGSSIRVIMPPMSEERRKSTAALVRKTSEDSKVAIRNIRREENDLVKKLLKEKEISEDVSKKTEEKIQKLTDDRIKELDTLVELKTSEIMDF
jgi:ribosome recycling factor